jgi:HPt (histidine-containing phosphotransfer) domain-containing protein
LIRILGDGLPNDLSELRAAAEQRDMSRIATLSHRLKGSAANMCADKLSSAAAMLERSARSSDADEVAVSLVNVEREIGFLLKALQCH